MNAPLGTTPLTVRGTRARALWGTVLFLGLGWICAAVLMGIPASDYLKMIGHNWLALPRIAIFAFGGACAIYLGIVSLLTAIRPAQIDITSNGLTYAGYAGRKRLFWSWSDIEAPRLVHRDQGVRSFKCVAIRRRDALRDDILFGPWPMKPDELAELIEAARVRGAGLEA
jgi:hypothetical protein